MSDGRVYSKMIATCFVDQVVARDYVDFIAQRVLPRVKAAGAETAHLLSRVDSPESGNIIECVSLYIWPSEGAREAYKGSQLASEIRSEVTGRFSKTVMLTPSAGKVDLELRL